MKVEAKDIPIMHKFMPEFWKAIKEFYNVENDDEYFDALHKKIENLYEIYPDSLARYLSLAFYKWAADVSNDVHGCGIAMKRGAVQRHGGE